ncbi:type II secretion system F family protein [Proteinivorax tanatarense]|uniref:Type II secretion system F family protein n=1 Tax=Proteinivorax tanatarense TaxID=1260629 RepID=A0AAU7VP01_9FIRM
MKEKQTIQFLDNLFYLLKGKISLSQAFEMMEKIGDETQKKTAIHISSNLKKGHNLYYSMDATQKFPKYVLELIKVGEEGEMLVKTLEEISLFLKQKKELKENVITSLIYPCILLTIVLFTIILTFVWLIPSMEAVYLTLGINKNILLKIILALPFPQIMLATALGLTIAVLLKTKKKGIRGIPLLGRILWDIEKMTYYEILYNTLKQGISLYKSLDLIQHYPSKEIKKIAHKQQQELQEGNSFTNALKLLEKNIIPLGFIEVGEKSSNLTDAVSRAKDFYKKELQIKTEGFAKAFEPLIMVIVAAIVFLIVVVLLYPIYNLLQNI